MQVLLRLLMMMMMVMVMIMMTTMMMTRMFMYTYVDADDVASSFGSQAAFRSQEKHSFSPNENNALSKTVRTLMKILTIITMVRFKNYFDVNEN